MIFSSLRIPLSLHRIKLNFSRMDFDVNNFIVTRDFHRFSGKITGNLTFEKFNLILVA